MRKRHLIQLLTLAFLLSALPTLALDHGTLKRPGHVHVITLPSANLAGLADADGVLPISVEVPIAVPDDAMRAFSAVKAASGQARLLEPRSLDRYPPGPDGETRWVTFDVAADAEQIQFEITSPTPFTFARIVVGNPFSPHSKLLGAFSEANNLALAKSEDDIILSGEDMLGTIEAVQRVRFPAGFLDPDTEAFDQMVSFGPGAFLPDDNNVDTIMIRTKSIPVGGTTPVLLLKFSNRSVRPITVRRSTGKPLHFEVKAGNSPNVESSGFITIRPNGTYQSTMRLVPVFSFQQVQVRELRG
jgi:hypothetical protein